MNVLSLFNGMGCIWLALDRAGIEVTGRYSSEIDKYANKVNDANYPDTVQIGDVRKVSAKDLPVIDLLVGGSPCQGFSFAGKGLAFDDPRSVLFLEFVRIYKECLGINSNLKYLLENVRMKKEHEDVISNAMGIQPLVINSSSLSAQNRVRLYWTNIGMSQKGLFGDNYCTIPQPADRGILLKDVLEKSVDEKYYLSEKALVRISNNKYSKPSINAEKTGTITTKNNSGQLSLDSGTTLITENFGVTNHDGELSETEKSTCIDANYHKSMDNHGQRTVIAENTIICHNLQPRTSKSGKGGTGPLSRNDGKSYCADTGNAMGIEVVTPCDYRRDEGLMIQKANTTRIRRLTETEVERLQTVPDNYTNHVSSTQRYKMLGNGWTVDVVAYILSYMKF